jgi:hypothetical protein
MQARFSTPSSLAAHHRRLIASCAESGCPQVRQTADAKSSARTVGESLCMSKSVEAHCKGQIVSARDLPTRCQQQCFSGSPHSTRATTSDRTERQITSKAADEATGTRRSTRSASTRISLPARCSDRRPAADEPDPAPATAPGGGHRWPGHRLRDHPLRVSRMVAASATHPTAPQAPEPFRDPPGEAIGVATSAGQAEGETYALLFGSGFIVQVMSSQQVDARAARS